MDERLTVRQLIEKLSEFDPDMKVECSANMEYQCLPRLEVYTAKSGYVEGYWWRDNEISHEDEDVVVIDAT